MKCEELQHYMADYLSKTLDGNQMREIELHLESCESCRRELEDVESVWMKLDALPLEEPGADSRARFDVMLNAYSHGLEEAPGTTGKLDRIDAVLRHIIPARPVFQAAAAVIFIALGVFSGRMIENGRQAEEEVGRLRAEMTEMRHLLTVSLMNQPSALDRLQGVTMSSELTSSGDDIPDALLKVLNTDPNVNVRLAAVDELGRYTGEEWVRTELVRSLSRSQPPFVQVSLIELLTNVKEKEAVDVFQALIDDEQTMDIVKKRARKGIENMI